MAYRRSYSRSRNSSSGYSRRSYSGSSRRSYSPTRSRSSYSSSRRSYYPGKARSSYSKTRGSYSPSRSRSSYGRSRSFSTRTKNGYSQYYDRRSGSWKFTHRRVAEKKLGGRIRPGYEVHHINGNKKDNRPSNLRVLSKSAHRAIHSGGGLRRILKRWRK